MNKLIGAIMGLLLVVGICLLSGYEGINGNIQWSMVIPGIGCLAMCAWLSSMLSEE